MQEEETYKNIFEAASKKLSHKEKASGRSRHIPEENLKIADDVNDMISKMRWMSEDLKNQVDNICKLYDVTIESVLKYVDDPSHFSPAQWESIQKSKEFFEKKVDQAIGKGAESNPSKKGRKGKFLGARNKWISMH